MEGLLYCQILKHRMSWVRGFLNHHNLVLRAKTSIAHALPGELENKIREFRRVVKQIQENGDFPYELIGNMDETPVSSVHRHGSI